MQLNLSGHHIDITPALRNYVSKKLERIERHFDNLMNVHVVFSVEKLRQKVEVTLSIGKTTLYADAGNENMYAAIDEVADKLDRQVIKYKEKSQDHRATDGGLKNQVPE